jgi:DUF1680 family protein
MKQRLLATIQFTAMIVGLIMSSQTAARSAETIRPVSFLDVKISDSLWAARQETNRCKTIPHVLGELKQRGSLSGFAVLAGQPAENYCGYMWADSDVYKTLEGIAYSLSTHPDPSLQKEAEQILSLIIRAQAADGYLMPHLQIKEPNYRHFAEETTRTCESYSQGHLIESMLAFYEATDRRDCLETAIKTADLLARVRSEGQLEQVSGHPGIELALVKLARTTSDNKYLELAKSYVAGARSLGSIWSAGRPFLADDELAGHAVAACYLYAGATDVAAITGDTTLLDLLKTKWEELAGRKMYVTGGTGHTSYQEGFAPDYDLPNEKAYCETCASLSLIFWSHRLFLAAGDARYIDVAERALYNGFLAGVNLGGDKFFYVNPLASRGNHHRQPWFGCTCCPTNIVRFLPALGQYYYASTNDTVYVNLYAAGNGKVKLGSRTVSLSQETSYPWDGRVRLSVNPTEPCEFTVAVRVPGWCREDATPGRLYRTSGPISKPMLTVNGAGYEAETLESGFARIRRQWKTGDVIELELPMPIRRLHADQRVRANSGRVALQRGPIVYCVEGVDHGGKVADLVLPPEAALAAELRPDLLGGVTVITGEANRVLNGGAAEAVALTAIPYYAWDHRAPGEMAVWMIEQPSSCGPTQTAKWVGSNYTPAYCVNQVQMWHDFRPEVVDRELAAAQEYFGINTLRVYLHNINHETEKDRFLANLDKFLEICQRHGIRPGLTFFDDCHRHEGIELDKPTEPVKGYHNGRWAACPQDRDRKPENLPKLQAYVQDVIRAHSRDPRVLWWEVFNEPNMQSEFSVRLRRMGYAWAKQVEPTQPVICCWDDTPETDLVNAHNYGADFTTWDRQADLNLDKGALFTEAGARWYAGQPSSGEPCEVIHWLQQRREAKSYVPGVYLCWELMAGNSNCRWYWGTPEGTREPNVPWCGLMWPDATPVSLAEAEAIRRWTTGQSRALFFDDFQDGPPAVRAGWTVHGGEASGSRVMRLEPGQKMIAGEPGWKDFVLEAVVMLHGQAGNAGVVLRANDPGPGPDQMRGYYVGFDTHLLYVGKIDNGWQQLGTFDLTKLDCAVVPGAWNQIRVAAEGPKLRVWFNRMHPSADKDAGLRLEVIDKSAPVLAGPVGLRTFNTSASFDNVIVLPLDALPSADAR